jgi:hypothetical protein
MLFAGKHFFTRRELLRGTSAGMVALAVGADTKAAQLSAKPPNIVVYSSGRSRLCRRVLLWAP